MIYEIDQRHYCDFDTIEINKLPPRSYFIPFEDREQAKFVGIKEKRYFSPKVRCLSGLWEFAFFPLPEKMPQTLDTDTFEFGHIDVPSCWQFRGFAPPFYLNTRYQFPYKPPVIPTTEKAGRSFFWNDTSYKVGLFWRTPENEYNYAGIYRKKFRIPDLEKAYVLSFLGVASCLDLYVNGTFAGYSEGSHNTAEFDITDLVHDGENELVAVVRRWCTGTYLECQDMFRNSGIFRDVLLRMDDKKDVWDIDPVTEKTEKGYRLDTGLTMTGDCEVRVTLKGFGFEECVTVQTENKKAHALFEVPDAKEWTAETPDLYELIIETDTVCVIQKIGFKNVRIEGNVYLFNGRKIKLHGVNHHDSDPKNGWCMTADDLERDVLLCKEYNIDTIRMSHYPPDPVMLELCMQHGIYVVDEADQETHGVFVHKLPPNMNRLADNAKWREHFMDRVRRLYHRDKLYATCIAIWSIGNESGDGCNTAAMYDWLKERTAIPVQYEGAVHSKRRAYDIASEMYPKQDHVRRIGEGTDREPLFMDRPYFMCEYAHAMGVGPGNAEDYWDSIYAHDNLMGGCVWEFCDHAVWHEGNTYTYGGDHGEWIHDGNFCVDGIFYPDRKPSTGAKIVRHLYRPIRIKKTGDGTFELFNTKGFTNAEAYELKITVTNGVRFTENLKIDPMSRREVKWELGKLPSDTRLTMTVTEKKSGRTVSTEQLQLTPFEAKTYPVEGTLPEWFSMRDGAPVIRIGESEMKVSDPYTILFRAQTDNDLDRYLRRFMKKYYNEKEIIKSVRGDDASVCVKTRITCKGHAFDCTDLYEATPEGVILTSRIHPRRGRGMLPRFGKAFRLPEDFDDVCYLGRTGESYADMKEQEQVAETICTVSQMTEPNLKPQESGNRADTRWAAVRNGNGAVYFETLAQPFELGVKPYTDTALAGMLHREDEKRTGTYVTVSAFQMGIGTASCGPATVKEYIYSAKEDHEMKILIRVTAVKENEEGEGSHE